MTKITEKIIDGKTVRWSEEYGAPAHRLTHRPKNAGAQTPKNPPSDPEIDSKTSEIVTDVPNIVEAAPAP